MNFSLAEGFSIVKDLTLTTAALVGMFVANKGLSTWNRQLKGGVEYELARKILRHTYRLRGKIKELRNPMIIPSEQDFPDSGRHLSTEEVRYFGIYHAYQMRWEKVNSVRDDLQAELLEAEVVWGKATYDYFDPLFDLQRELFVDVKGYLASTEPNANGRAKEQWRQIRQSRREVIYDLATSGDDEYSTDVAKAIAGIESYLKPHLSK